MKLDTTLIRGDADKPALVFIHGLGMDKGIWESPNTSRILGGKFPIHLLVSTQPEAEIRKTYAHRGITKRLFFGKPPRHLITLFHDFLERGYTVIAWSQQRPAAGIAFAVSELKEVVNIHRKYCRSGIILIGHSRGGLVARNYSQYEAKGIRAIITLATPHRGSKMALWVKHVAPLITLIDSLISDSEKGTFTYAAKRVFDFLKSTAVKELLPDSPFFRSCDKGPLNGIYYVSCGGSNPALFSVYRRVIERIHTGDKEQRMVRAQQVFSVPGAFEKFIPERLFPDEMKRGKGDGLVSVESSRIPWADEHYTLDVNHAGILFDESVRHRVIDAVRRLG
ncbi:MAG TPA: hypothetical protein VEI46_04535 [Thermodesulfovibrionales bacterium]|nr:hypothetical protein [Thermodesulfovibrionales bacterium]